MAQKNNGNHELIFILDRFEGSKAVLIFEKQELVIPRRVLGRDVQEGDALKGEFITDKVNTQRRENLAKAMLKEILGGE